MDRVMFEVDRIMLKTIEGFDTCEALDKENGKRVGEKMDEALQHARRKGHEERDKRVLYHDGGIYPPDRNVYLVENQGDNRKARRLANRGKKKK